MKPSSAGSALAAWWWWWWSCCCGTGVRAINPGGFPNAMDGAIRGWRSWNAVTSDVTQDFVLRQVHAISKRELTPAGAAGPVSLLDLGFGRVGIDSGWASCAEGVNGSWHGEDGHFLINETKFPDMKSMVDTAHAVGVKMDFYLNQDIDPGWHNCKSEGSIPGAAANTGNFASYVNDVHDMVSLGFDGVKFDNGGGNDDMNRWAQELNASGRPILIENCNNGGYVPYPAPKLARPMLADGGSQAMDEETLNCPFNMFRTGIDEAPSPLSTVSNLIDLARYLNVSRPGCWAYPDMLELGAPVVGPFAARPDPQHPTGRASTCGPDDGTVGDTGPRLTLEQGKAQFAAWCSVSSPLILGFDLGNATEYARWFPVVSNTLALSIQSSWAGLAGKMLAAGPTFRTVVPHGATCEDMQDTRDLPSYSVWGKPVWASPNGTVTTTSVNNGTIAWALTAINSVNTSQTVSLALQDLQGLNTADGIAEHDVWSGAERPIAAGAVSWDVQLGPNQHRFVLLRAQTSRRQDLANRNGEVAA